MVTDWKVFHEWMIVVSQKLRLLGGYKIWPTYRRLSSLSTNLSRDFLYKLTVPWQLLMQEYEGF